MQNASRIELHPISQRVQVHVDGKLLANSNPVLELRERGYLTSHYIPLGEVRMDLLATSKTTIHCPFKGSTVYFSLGENKDIAWSYEQPIEGMEALTGKVAFYEQVSK